MSKTNTNEGVLYVMWRLWVMVERDWVSAQGGQSTSLQKSDYQGRKTDIIACRIKALKMKRLELGYFLI